jgi:hypothetical protein
MTWDQHVNHLFYDPGIVCRNKLSKKYVDLVKGFLNGGKGRIHRPRRICTGTELYAYYFSIFQHENILFIKISTFKHCDRNM